MWIIKVPHFIYVGSFESGKWIISDNVKYLTEKFPSDYIHVSRNAAAFVTLCVILTAMVVISAHVLTIVYRDYCNSSVKAASSRLNHFVYFGCYMVLITYAAHRLLFITLPFGLRILASP